MPTVDIDSLYKIKQYSTLTYPLLFLVFIIVFGLLFALLLTLLVYLLWKIIQKKKKVEDTNELEAFKNINKLQIEEQNLSATPPITLRVTSPQLPTESYDPRVSIIDAFLHPKKSRSFKSLLSFCRNDCYREVKRKKRARETSVLTKRSHKNSFLFFRQSLRVCQR